MKETLHHKSLQQNIYIHRLWQMLRRSGTGFVECQHIYIYITLPPPHDDVNDISVYLFHLVVLIILNRHELYRQCRIYRACLFGTEQG